MEEEDYAEAKELAENAITLGSVDAMFLYGNLYEDGSGVEADKEQALYWYKKAAEKGTEHHHRSGRPGGPGGGWLFPVPLPDGKGSRSAARFHPQYGGKGNRRDLYYAPSA